MSGINFVTNCSRVTYINFCFMPNPLQIDYFLFPLIAVLGQNLLDMMGTVNRLSQPYFAHLGQRLDSGRYFNVLPKVIQSHLAARFICLDFEKDL